MTLTSLSIRPSSWHLRRTSLRFPRRQNSSHWRRSSRSITKASSAELIQVINAKYSSGNEPEHLVRPLPEATKFSMGRRSCGSPLPPAFVGFYPWSVNPHVWASRDGQLRFPGVAGSCLSVSAGGARSLPEVFSQACPNAANICKPPPGMSFTYQFVRVDQRRFEAGVMSSNELFTQTVTTSCSVGVIDRPARS